MQNKKNLHKHFIFGLDGLSKLNSCKFILRLNAY